MLCLAPAVATFLREIIAEHHKLGLVLLVVSVVQSAAGLKKEMDRNKTFPFLFSLSSNKSAALTAFVGKLLVKDPKLLRLRGKRYK